MSEELEEPGYVVVIGAAGIDSKGRASVPLTLGSSTPGQVRVSVGGTGRNVADNLARLGVDAVLLTAVGDDDSGKQVLEHAAEVGLDTDYVIVSPDHRTSAYVALLNEHGDLVMSVDDMNVMACLTPQVVNEQRDLIKEAAMVVIDANLSKETLATVMRIANRYKVPVCADPASTLLAPKLKPLLPKLYMVTPNIPEAKVLCGCSIDNEEQAITAARQLVNAGVDIALITLAEAGVVYATADASGHVPAMVTQFVDPTGASDAMTATVVFGLLNDIPIDEAVRLGASAAALTLSCADTVCVDLSLELLYDHLMI
jgi:pseudouridine kinase